MEVYLGETIVKQKDTKFKKFGRKAWAMYFLEKYGGFGQAHHQSWVLDQMARILKGTPLIIRIAKWSNGSEEYRISTGEPSKDYIKWVAEMCSGGYSYDEGIAP